MLNFQIILGILTILGFIGALPQTWGSSWKNALWVVAQNFIGSTLEKAIDILLLQGVPRHQIRTAAVVDKTMPWKHSQANTDRY